VIEAETDADADSLSPEEEAELADAFEEAYAPAWQEEAERTVRDCSGTSEAGIGAFPRWRGG
jgi:hypothetical protein